MHLFLPFLGCLILTTSCTRYQYATIESNTLGKNNHSQFVAENDTMRVIYSFRGENAPMLMVIENKSDLPLYINWKQSALIVNDKAITYAPSETAINGSISAVGWGYGYNNSVSVGSVNGTATTPEVMDFIPPHTYITKQPLSVTNMMVPVPDSLKRKVPMYSIAGDVVRVRQTVFSEGNSPLRFKSYMTVAVGSAEAKPVALEHTFYVSELITTGLKPETFGYDRQTLGNKYYISRSTGYGRTMTGFGVIAGTAVIAGATQALTESVTK